MTGTTPHHAKPFHWSEIDRTKFNSASSCILELRARIEALEAGATCPHIVSSDEGTSYCALAEASARIGQSDVPADTSAPTNSKPSSNSSQIRSSLVEAVRQAILMHGDGLTFSDEARAAIRAVAEWLRVQRGWEYGSWALEQEAGR